MMNLPFKQLKVWQKSMQLAKASYEATEKIPLNEQFALAKQIRGAAISVASNIAEGSQRVSDKDFAKFLLIAKGSLAELETQVLLAVEFGYITDQAMQPLISLIIEVSKMLRALHAKLYPTR